MSTCLITSEVSLAHLVKVGSAGFLYHILLFFSPFITDTYLGGDTLRQFKHSVFLQT